MGSGKVFSPDRAGEAIWRIICHCDGFFFCFERSDMAAGAEDFFLNDG